MSGHHHHHHNEVIEDFSKAFRIGIVLNLLFVFLEFVAGLYYNSLALLSDSGHNLGDVAGLGISLFAFSLSRSKSTKRFTYGYNKSTILASLANAVILLIAVGSIGWEAIQRFIHPVQTQGKMVAIVATVGIFINALSAFFFFKNRHHDLNVKGAYLHLLTDALVSVGVVIAGIIISYTGITWIDPLISLLIMFVVIVSTWSLLKESLKLSLDAVPSNVEIEKVKMQMLNSKGVRGIHHIHIWAVSTTINALTAHIILEKGVDENDIAKIKSSLKHELEHLNIHHATLETEYMDCNDEKC